MILLTFSKFINKTENFLYFVAAEFLIDALIIRYVLEVR